MFYQELWFEEQVDGAKEVAFRDNKRNKTYSYL